MKDKELLEKAVPKDEREFGQWAVRAIKKRRKGQFKMLKAKGRVQVNH